MRYMATYLRYYEVFTARKHSYSIVLVMVLAYNSNYLSYYNCMAQTKSDTITQKGADHVAAQCKAFILEKMMVK